MTLTVKKIRVASIAAPAPGQPNTSPFPPYPCR